MRHVLLIVVKSVVHRAQNAVAQPMFLGVGFCGKITLALPKMIVLEKNYYQNTKVCTVTFCTLQFQLINAFLRACKESVPCCDFLLDFWQKTPVELGQRPQD